MTCVKRDVSPLIQFLISSQDKIKCFHEESEEEERLPQKKRRSMKFFFAFWTTD